MTILEAIKSNPISANVPNDFIESILIGRSISGAALYDVTTLKEVELATADIYASIATMPEFSEGGLSLKYNADTLITRALVLYNKHNDPKASEIGPQTINLNVSFE